MSVTDLSLGYAGTPELFTNLALSVAPCSVLSIVGKSGVGKSTLLRAFAGLEAPLAGSVQVAGMDPGVAAKRGAIGIAFQDPTLIEWKNVLDNVLLPVRLRRRVESADRERALSLIEEVGLTGCSNRYPSELSGGMRQRVAIARSLVTDPVVLLLDEPFAWLDEITRLDLALGLERWRGSTTTILVTHSVTEAVLVSDVVLCMDGTREPKVKAIGIPRPRTASTLSLARFSEVTQEIRNLLSSRDPSH